MPKIFSAEEALEIIFKQMEREGLVTGKMLQNERQILEALKKSIEDISPQFTLENLMNKNVQKCLMGAIISHTLKMEPNEFLKLLKKEKDNGFSDTPNPELDKKFKPVFELLLVLTQLIAYMQLDKTPKLRPEGKKIFHEFEEELEKKLENDPKKDKMMAELNNLAKQMDDYLINLFAGYNPKRPTDIPRTMLGAIIGIVFVATGISDVNSTAEVIKEITYHKGVADPSGRENIAKIIDEALGIIGAISMNIDKEAQYQSNLFDKLRPGSIRPLG